MNEHVLPAFCVLRAPRYPFGELAAVTARAPDREALAGDRAAHAVDEAMVHARAELSRWCTRDDVAEALRHASTSLAAATRASPPGDRSARREGVTNSLFRYLSRMSTRATPFGLLAGYALVQRGPCTRLARADARAVARSVGVADNALEGLIGRLERDESLAPHLRYAPNTTLRTRDDELCLAVTGPGSDGAPETRWLTVARAPHLGPLLEGWPAAPFLRRAEVVRRFVVEAGLPPDDADALTALLCAHGLLVSELAERVPGEGRLAQLARVLEAAAPHHPALAAVSRTERALAQLEVSAPSAAPEHERAAREAIEHLAGAAQGSPFDIDSRLVLSEASVSSATLRELLRGAQALAALGRSDVSPAWSTFCRAFAERYGERTVPLLDVLDAETGIGYGGSFLGARLESSRPEQLSEPPATTPHAALLSRVRASLRCPGPGVPELELDPREPGILGGDALPDAFVAWAELARDPREGERLIVRGYAGPSAVWPFGRFAARDPDLRAKLEALVRAEEALAPDTLFAEVAYAPHAAMAPLVRRPALRQFEIEYLGRSTLPRERCLALTDLRVCVRGQQVSLWSERHGRRVEPRVASAHLAAASTFAVYRFLRAVEDGGGRARGGLSLPAPCPRIRLGRVILHEASWQLGRHELTSLRSATPLERLRAVHALRDARGMPRWVRVGAGDTWLTADLDHPLGTELLVRELGASPAHVVKELWPAPDELALDTPEGPSVHELLVPFVRGTPARTPRPELRAPAARRAPDEGLFVPGSEWLSVHLYGSPQVVDRLLGEVVAPFVAEQPALARFFFLRCDDPTFHLRLRFAGSPEQLLGELYPALRGRLAPWLARGALWRVELQSYDQERERYGGAQAVALAERLFELDSRAALALVLRGDDGDDARRPPCLVALHGLLSALCPEHAAAEATLEAMRRQGMRALRGGTALERHLSDLHRRHGAALGRELANVVPDPAVRELASGYQRLHTAGLLTTALPDSAASFLHMAVNRRFAAQHAFHELVLVDALLRHTRSARVRGTVHAGAHHDVPENVP